MKTQFVKLVKQVGLVFLLVILAATFYLIGHKSIEALFLSLVCIVPGLIAGLSILWAYSRSVQSKSFEIALLQNQENLEWLYETQTELRVRIDGALWGIGRNTLRERLCRIDRLIEKNGLSSINGSSEQQLMLNINKIEMIKIVDALYRIGSFSSRSGQKISKKEVMLIFGRLFGQDWNTYARNLSLAYKETSVEKNVALFDVLKIEVEEESKRVNMC